MKRIVRGMVVFAVMVMALSVAAPAFAERGEERGDGNRPFSASGWQVCGTNGCTGRGTATHLGRFTITSAAGGDVLTAANGDQLVISLDWSTIQVDFPGVAPCPSTGFGARLDAAVTGGTGRFAHASGAVKYVACSSDEVHYTFFINGAISY